MWDPPHDSNTAWKSIECAIPNRSWIPPLVVSRPTQQDDSSEVVLPSDAVKTNDDIAYADPNAATTVSVLLQEVSDKGSYRCVGDRTKRKALLRCRKKTPLQCPPWLHTKYATVRSGVDLIGIGFVFMLFCDFQIDDDRIAAKDRGFAFDLSRAPRNENASCLEVGSSGTLTPHGFLSSCL